MQSTSKNTRMKVNRSPTLYLDPYLSLVTLSLLMLGLVMVASASMPIAQLHHQSPWHFFLRQGVYTCFALGVGFVALIIPVNCWQRWGMGLLLTGFFLLLLVMVPGVGREVNGSTRWLVLGPITVQVSELVKFCLISYLARYLVRYGEQVRAQAIGFIKPMVIIGLLALLLLLQPDFGALVVLTTTALIMLFMAGVRWRHFAVLLLGVAAAFSFLAISAPYRLARMTSFLHPWSDQYGSGYQLTQSLIAFGRGGWFGEGLGSSIQKLFYLPEAHTDFLLAILGEELGLVGVLAVVVLFVILLMRGLWVAKAAERKGRLFHAYMAYGLSVWLGLQAVINIGVNTGLLPTKGLTLPLMSYGGSSLVMSCVAIGVLLRIELENHVGE